MKKIENNIMRSDYDIKAFRKAEDDNYERLFLNNVRNNNEEELDGQEAYEYLFYMHDDYREEEER
jgi:hypothetical protein